MALNKNHSVSTTVKRVLLFILGLYLVNVLMFSLVYWITWVRSPDFFIVSAEVNRMPLEALLSIVVDDEKSLQYNSVDSDVQFAGDELIRQFGDVLIRKSELRDRRDSAISELRRAFDIMDARAESDFQKHLDLEMARFDEEEARILIEIEQLSSELVGITDPSAAAALTTSQAELRVQQAELNADRAAKEYELLRDYFDKREQFIDPEQLSKVHAANEILDDIESELQDAERSYFDLRSKIWNTWVQMYDSRIGQLAFGDFLYFSLSVSTANTFGDIIPNHAFVRAAVVVQLLFNIFLLGLAVSLLADRLVKPRPEEAYSASLERANQQAID